MKNFKKFRNRVIIVVGIALFTFLTATAVFAAGQYFHILPNPEYIGIGCVIGIILLILGVIIGKTIKNKSE